MFINKALFWFQNSKAGRFLADSIIFQNIDNISFGFLILSIVSTTFMQTEQIGLFVLGFVLSCLIKILAKPGETVKISFINKVLIIYLLFVIISLMGASCFLLSLKGIMKTFTYFAFYFCAAHFLFENKKCITPVVLTIAGCVATESIIAILQNLHHVEEIATWQDVSNVVNPENVISRAYGTLKPYNPNLLAGYLMAGLSSLFALFGVSYLKKNRNRMVLFGALFAICIFAIFVTGCRGAYLGLFGFASVILLYGLYFVKKHGGFNQIKTKHKAAAALALGLFAGVMCFIPSFQERIMSIFSLRKDSSISFRMNVYEACYQMFLDNRFLGIGVGNKNFREIYGLYMKTGYDALGAYSVPLEIAVESGIFALLSFLVFIIYVLVYAVKYTLDSEIIRTKRVLIFGILLTVVSVMFHGFFDTIFFRPQVQIIFWLNIAIFHVFCIRTTPLTQKQ